MNRSLAALALALIVSACGSSSSNSPTSPTSSGGGGGTNLVFPAGTWVGTLTRPAAPSIAVTWVATRGPAPNSMSSGSFEGPMTLTYAGVSIVAQLTGFLGGSNTAVMGGYRFNFDISITNPPPAAPNCRIFRFGPSTPTTNLRDSSTTITTADFQMQYSDCQGFIEPPLPSNSLRETTQLTLTRQ